MNNIATPIETLFEKAENYSKTSLELLTLKAIDKSADVGSSFGVGAVILTVIATFALTINIGVALWLSELLGKSYYGFFMVAVFYLIVTILLYFFRNEWIKIPMSNTIIRTMTKKKTR